MKLIRKSFSPQLEHTKSRRARSMSLQPGQSVPPTKPRVTFALDVEPEESNEPQPFYVYEPTEVDLDSRPPPPVKPISGFRTEFGSDKAWDANPEDLYEPNKHMPYFKKHFETQAHAVFMGGDENNPAIAAVLLEPEEGHAQLKTILWLKNDTYHKFLPVPASKKKIKEALHTLYATELKETRLVEIKEGLDKIDADLYNMEDRMLVKHYSFGVLYAKAGQKTEDEMFSNKDDDTSRAYKDFLNLIGDKVKLEGFPGPKCGLDTKTNTTGNHTYYTHFAGYDIVYHVATLLPFSEVNPQQVERKRHLGNDVIMILFCDGVDMIDPDIFHTKFTHVFAVVQHYKDDHDKSRFRIGIANKPGVREYGPTLPNISWKLGTSFREFLLTKLINGERAAYYAPGFSFTRTRRMWLTELVQKYLVCEK